MDPVRLDPRADDRWMDLLGRAPQTLAFHHPAWLALLADQYGYRCEAVALAEPGGRLVAGLPICRVESRLTGRRLVALPFSDLCPPLVAADAPPAAAGALADAVRAAQAEAGLTLEVRGPLDGATDANRGARFLHHVLDLTPGPEAVLAAAHSQNRRGVNKARKAGVTVEARTDRDGLDAFYALHLETRRRQGVPIQPLSFIRRLESLFAAGLGYVLLARHEGATAAAAVFVGYGPTLTYKYGASDTEHLAVRPNNAIFAEAFERACAAGFEQLDFGRTDLDNPGLAAFKRNWGAEEREVAYTVLPEAPSDADAPPGLARRAAAQVIRRSPPAVGRLIGTALYRHFG